jgi:hypothetical protein
MFSKQLGSTSALKKITSTIENNRNSSKAKEILYLIIGHLGLDRPGFWFLGGSIIILHRLNERKDNDRERVNELLTNEERHRRDVQQKYQSQTEA